MFSFFQSVIDKATALVVGIFIAIGLVSSPPPISMPASVTQESVPQTVTDQIAPTEIEKLKQEIEALKSKQRASENLAAISAKVIIPPKPVAPKTFTTPSGAIVDEHGNILNQAELTQKQLLEELQKQRTLLEQQKSTGFSSVEIASRIKPAVVLVTVGGGHGSGFFIESDGLILTNAHVVEGESSVSIKLYDGRTYTGSVVGRNEIVDLALVRIGASGLSTVTLGDSSVSFLPDTSSVYAFGYPRDPSTMTVERGDITARRTIEGIEYLQTNAGIQKGNSGGPLVNDKAEVIGINILALVTKEGLGVGFNFTLPINTAKTYLPQLRSGEQILKYSSSAPVSPITLDSTPPIIETVTYSFSNNKLMVGFRVNEELGRSNVILYPKDGPALDQQRPPYSTTQGVIFSNVPFLDSGYKIRIFVEDRAGNSKYVDVFTTSVTGNIEINR